MSNKRVLAALLCVLVLAIGASYYTLRFLDRHPAYRVALDHAAGGEPGWPVAAAGATWLLPPALLVLALFMFLRRLGRLRAWLLALFLDMPALLDDLWRARCSSIQPIHI
jgi:hypothetical protein